MHNFFFLLIWPELLRIARAQISKSLATLVNYSILDVCGSCRYLSSVFFISFFGSLFILGFYRRIAWLVVANSVPVESRFAAGSQSIHRITAEVLVLGYKYHNLTFLKNWTPTVIDPALFWILPPVNWVAGACCYIQLVLVIKFVYCVYHIIARMILARYKHWKLFQLH